MGLEEEIFRHFHKILQFVISNMQTLSQQDILQPRQGKMITGPETVTGTVPRFLNVFYLGRTDLGRT